MSDDANAGDVVAIPAEQAAYPPRQVWAAAGALAGFDQIDLDGADDEIRAAYYGKAEDALIAAQDAAASPSGETGGYAMTPGDSAWEPGGDEFKAMEAELAAWIEQGAHPWELPASAVHFALGCHDAEANAGGTSDALAAVSDECDTCSGGRFYEDGSACETCDGHGVVPKPASPAGETGDGRELWLARDARDAADDLSTWSVPPDPENAKARGDEVIRVREIPSEEAGT